MHGPRSWPGPPDANPGRFNPRTATIPVVALSAGALKTDIDHALKAGFVEYLTKPLRLPRLMETLERIGPRSG